MTINYTINENNIKVAEQVLLDNGIEKDECQIVLLLSLVELFCEPYGTPFVII